jgi:hypothetical protein
MSKLIPTVITDVNGKVTTVHKKQVEARNTPAVPAPRAKAVWPPIRQDAEVLGELVNALGLRIQSISPKVRDNIVSLTDDDVEILKNALSSPPPGGMKPELFQASMVYPMNTDDGEAGHHMKNTMVLLESELPVYRHQQFLVALRKHSGFREVAYDLYAADDDSKKLVCGVANAIHMLSSFESVIQDKYGNERPELMVNAMGKQLKLRDKDLFAAILDHPQYAESIAALYLERGNLAAIDEVINSSAAIREGAL